MQPILLQVKNLSRLTLHPSQTAVSQNFVRQMCTEQKPGDQKPAEQKPEDPKLAEQSKPKSSIDERIKKLKQDQEQKSSGVM